MLCCVVVVLCCVVLCCVVLCAYLVVMHVVVFFLLFAIVIVMRSSIRYPPPLGQMVELIEMDHLRGTFGCVRSMGAYRRDDDFSLVSVITDDGFIYHCAPGSVRCTDDVSSVL